MSKRFDWGSIYKVARKNVRPSFNKFRNMDSDDWLASIGLERRNIAADIAGAFGFVFLGCAIGVGVGLLLAPKRGSELRQDLTKRVRATADQFTASREGANSPTYAS